MTLNFQSLKFCKQTEETQQSICANFNTNLKQLEKDVQVLKDWLKSQPHLPQCSSDTMLRSFLVACKNNMEKAKTKIENYYTTRAEIPEYFSERDPTDEKITTDGEIIHVYSLPNLTPDGYRVSFQAFTTKEAKQFDIYAYAKRALMVEDIVINMDVIVNGEYIVLDGKHFSASHLMKITPSLCRNLVHCAQNVLPIRIKGIIFINSPSYIEILLGLLKPFMKSKLVQRVHVHSGGVETLEKYFPKAILPKDYGGEEEFTCAQLNESWMKCLRDNRDWFLNEGQLKAEVNKNTVSSQKNGKFEEMQGSFKTLCID